MNPKSSSWEKFDGTWYNINNELSVVIHQSNKGWLIRIEFTGTVDFDINNLGRISKKWNKDSTGYNVNIDNKSKLVSLLKSLKIKPLPNNFN